MRAAATQEELKLHWHRRRRPQQEQHGQHRRPALSCSHAAGEMITATTPSTVSEEDSLLRGGKKPQIKEDCTCQEHGHGLQIEEEGTGEEHGHGLRARSVAMQRPFFTGCDND